MGNKALPSRFALHSFKRFVWLGITCLLLGFAFTGIKGESSQAALLSTPPRQAAHSGPSYRPMPGQPQVDANTLVLYHFDTPNGNIVTDATGNHNGTIYGNPDIRSALYGDGLRFDGGTYIRTGNLSTPGNPDGLDQQGTIEAFVDFAEACPQVSGTFAIASIGGERGTNQTVAWLGVNGMLYFWVRAPNGYYYYATSNINPCRYLVGNNGSAWPFETWRFHHVAGTWGPHGVEIWVDGVLHGVGVLVEDISQLPAIPDAYSCNPQEYVGNISDVADNWFYPPNPYYPSACPDPQRGQPLPPYAYTGGLLPYTTFLIGCDAGSGWPCFRGRLDEVRISKIQRDFLWTIDPTSTPTPTPIPEQIRQYNVDSNTLALFHLDQVGGGYYVFDSATAGSFAVPDHASTFYPGKYANALVLDGTNCLQLGNPAFPTNGTFEAWIRLESTSVPFYIFSVNPSYPYPSERAYLGVVPPLTGGNLVFAIQEGEIWHVADSGMTPASLFLSWHHVAASWGLQGMSIWIDGYKRGSNGYWGQFPQPVHNYTVGCGMERGFAQLLIDELRISSVQRRFAVYVPPATRTPTISPTLYLNAIPAIGH